MKLSSWKEPGIISASQNFAQKNQIKYCQYDTVFKSNYLKLKKTKSIQILNLILGCFLLSISASQIFS